MRSSCANIPKVSKTPQCAAILPSSLKRKMSTPLTLNCFPVGAMPMNESRAQAMHDCNMKAQPYSFSTWETTQFAVYGTCMTEHGQTP